MIILFNLNKYIGGGETLLIRLAQYLKSEKLPYLIVTSSSDCWIANESLRLKLHYIAWPVKSDSIHYLSRKDISIVTDYFYNTFRYSHCLRIFTFCMRDLHNALYIFSRLKDIKVHFSHGIYHPEDVFYLSSFSFTPKSIIKFNRNIANVLHNTKSILFVNNNGLKVSLSPNTPCTSELIEQTCFAPLPIEVPRYINKCELPNVGPVKIICISRFVSFKVAAVLSVMRFVADNPCFELVIIGHGRWKVLLDTWILLNKARRIKLLTNIAPNQLDEIIDQCHIGYAQGTSILEIAKRGLPVLVAPYSRIRDIFNKKFPTLGIFGDIKDSSVFGDITDLTGQTTYRLSDKIYEVVANYKYYQKKSVVFVKSFSTDVICKDIIGFIKKSQFSNKDLEFNPPSAPIFKRILKMFVNKV